MDNIFIDIAIAVFGFFIVKTLLKGIFSKNKETKTLKMEYTDLISNPKYKVQRKSI